MLLLLLLAWVAVAGLWVVSSVAVVVVVVVLLAWVAVADFPPSPLLPTRKNKIFCWLE